jgi:ABC-type multidrug transport system permease subunit
MRLKALIKKDFLRSVSDRRALVVNLVLPLIITFIMGLSFGGGLFGQSSGISAIPLALVGSDLPEMLKERLAEGLRESDFFEVTWTDSLTADSMVRNGQVTAAVVLPPGMVENFFRMNPVAVQLWKDPGSELKSGIVEQIIARSLRQYQAGEAAYLSLWPAEEYSELINEDNDLDESFFSGDFATIWKRWRNTSDDPKWVEARTNMVRAVDRHLALSEAMGQSVVTMTVHDKSPVGDSETPKDINLFDYFLPGFSVFFMMFAISASARDLHREKTNGTLHRQLLSPVRGFDLLLGKWVSAALQGIFQLMVLYLIGAVLFQINLGPDFWSLPLAVVLCCTAGSGLFTLIALITPTDKMMDNVSTVVVLISAMVGGNMMPLDSMPLWVHSFGRFGFNYWANVSFNDIMAKNQSVGENIQPLLVLLFMTLGFLLASLVLVRLKTRKGVWA